MTESEWLKCNDLGVLLKWLQKSKRHRPTLEKLQQFDRASCRRIAHLLNDETYLKALDLADRLAEGKAKIKEYYKLWPKLQELLSSTHSEREWSARCAVLWVWNSTDSYSPETKSLTLASHAADAIGPRKRKQEEKYQCELLRHILGNPFRPYPVPGYWPSAVMQLAQALNAGEDCAFAMHDALIEAAHPELAEHFQEREHPKGCWAIDLIYKQRTLYQRKPAEHWIKQMKNRDSDMRDEAIKAMQHIGPEKAVVEALARALRDREAQVRADAAYALSKFGTAAKTAFPVLLAALKDRAKLPYLPNTRVADVANLALRKIDPKETARLGIS
jgi:hypothetical protein